MKAVQQRLCAISKNWGSEHKRASTYFAGEIMKAYIVKIGMASQGRIDSSTEINEKTREIVYQFDKETRNKIGAIRGECINHAGRYLLDFHGIHLAREDSLSEIERIVERARDKLSQVSPELSARITIFPLDMGEVKKGELYSQIIALLRAKIYESLIDKIKPLMKKSTITERNKEALVRVIAEIGELNVFNDKDIEDELDLLANLVNEKVRTAISPVEQDLMGVIKSIESRWANIEI